MKSLFNFTVILLMFFSGQTVLSNNDTLIHKRLDSIIEPANKVSFLLMLAKQQSSNRFDVSEKSIQLADSIVMANKLVQFYGDVYFQKGDVFYQKGDYFKALINLHKAEQHYSENKNAFGLAKTYNKFGIVHISQADFPEALNYFIKSLNIKDSIGDTEGISDTYSNIGNVLFEMYDTQQALAYFLKSIDIDKKQENKLGMAKTQMNVGLVYKENFNYDKALEYFEKSLSFHLKNNNLHEIANCYVNIALVDLESNNGKQSLNYFNKALTIYQQLGSKKGMASVLSNIGFYYSLQGKYVIAISNLKKAVRIAQDINSIQDIELTSQAISDAYQRIGNYKEAYNYYVLYKLMYDKLNNDDNARAFTQMEMNYEFEQQKKEIEFKQQQKELQHKAEIKRQRMLMGFMISGALGLFVFAVYMYRNYKQKQKDNKLLRTQKKAIEEQHDKINKQKKDITDSIKYAKRIQTAILPPNDMLDKLLINYFVLFKPRDIVSGDYYWASHKDNKSIIVAADCTGHGVPGAFMSMLGISFLNEIIQQEVDISSNNILNRLREYVIKSLRQTGKIGETQDGMDLSIVVIDRDNNKLQFSGAYNSLLLIRNSEIIIYKADKMPIGISHKSEQPFTSHLIEYKKNDTIYMLSDGYVDQFGGPTNSKFKSKPFKELLLNIQKKSMTAQKEILNATIEAWKGDYEQIDDILVIGIRL